MFLDEGSLTADDVIAGDVDAAISNDSVASGDDDKTPLDRSSANGSSLSVFGRYSDGMPFKT